MYVFDAAKLFTTQYPLYASTHPPGRRLSSAGPIPHQSFIRSGTCAPDTPGTRPAAGSWARAKSTRYGNYRLRAAECLGVRSPALHATQAHHPRNTSSSHLFRDVQGERGGVIAGERVRDMKG